MPSPEHFDAVIIGSGFGGSVMAHNLAAAKMSVCVLERGKPYPPGSFPRDPYGTGRNFWDPSEGLQGLFDIWSFRDMEAVVSSGLGGGSLIYANVILRKDEKWFVKDGLQDGVYEYWPVTRADLDPHYDRVEPILNVQKYPLDRDPYSGTLKTLALKEAAEKLGLEWFLPNLAVTFGPTGGVPLPGLPIAEDVPNLHGLPRSTCRLCGECDVGCNYGSKNTLDYNYLSLAKRDGADIRTLHEVRSFAPREGGGFVVKYVVHTPDNEGRKIDTDALPIQTMTADRLILSAGTLGTTYLLLKNRASFPGLSSQLGTRFSGNGDLLSFAIDATETVDGKERPRRLKPNFGPVITSTVRIPDAADGNGATGRGYYVQDAGYPNYLAWLVESANMIAVLKRAGKFIEDRLFSWLTHDPKSEIGREISRLVGPGTFTATSVPLLGMGRDRPDGRLTIERKGENELLELNWTDVKSREYYSHIINTSRQLAEAMGAKFEEDPMNFIHRFVTAHPLGGCPMGRNDNEGVVDSFGQVFNYPGLYIADGSVMPGPVGANPSLTIAALSDRFAQNIIERK